MQPVLEVLKTHHADNFGWALACCGWDRESAEDVLQEAYLRVLDGRADFAGKSAAKTWFFAVIKRVAADVRRTGVRRSRLSLRLFASETDSPMPADGLQEAVYAGEAAGQLQQALMQLSVRQREIVHLVFYGELTLEESAGVLQVSIGSARTHYQRAKTRLATLLEGFYETQCDEADDNE